MTNLPIHITTHHLSLSEPPRRFTRKNITPVTRFSASARLALPGRDVHGRAVDSNLYVAIGKLVAKLGRLLRKRKTRLARSFANARLESSVGLPQPPAPSHSKESSEPPAGRSHVRRREGGQEMRVFPFRRRLPLTFAPSYEVMLPSGIEP